MSWLEERILTAEYGCVKCGNIVQLNYVAKEGIPSEEAVMAFYESQPHALCDKSYMDEPPGKCVFKFIQTLPVAMGGTTVVEYEHNGRKGLRIKTSDGQIQHRAKSKDIYLRTGTLPKDLPQSKDSVAEKAFMKRMTQ